MFASKTLHFFLGIAAIAAISSPTSVLGASVSRRMKKDDKKAKKGKGKSDSSSDDAPVTLTTHAIRDAADGQTVVYGITSGSPDPVIIGVTLTPDLVDVDADDAVIGTSDITCAVTRIEPTDLTLLCNIVACFGEGDCIFLTGKNVVALTTCTVPAIGIVIGGTGAYANAAGSWLATTDCETTIGSIRTTTVITFASGFEMSTDDDIIVDSSSSDEDVSSSSSDDVPVPDPVDPTPAPVTAEEPITDSPVPAVRTDDD